MGGKGVEPSRAFAHNDLNVARLPFRHPPVFYMSYFKTETSEYRPYIRKPISQNLTYYTKSAGKIQISENISFSKFVRFFSV